MKQTLFAQSLEIKSSNVRRIFGETDSICSWYPANKKSHVRRIFYATDSIYLVALTPCELHAFFRICP